MILDKKKLKRLIEKLRKDEIILMCDIEKCPRYNIQKKEDYDYKKAVIMILTCDWHDSDSEIVDYLDKNLEHIIK